MGLSDEAEASHWPPFLAAGAKLVREKQRAGKDAGPLKAFLYGVLSHQVADVGWHSLGIRQGLLQVMSETEFDGNTDDAHSTLDIGGDMIQVHRLLASGSNINWLSESWTYDSEDIITILSRMGFQSVSTTQLTYCMAQGRAALTAELNVARIGYIKYAQKSPTLFDGLEDYFAGGMVDMHMQTVECLDSFESWFDEPSRDPWDLCQVFDGKRPHQELKLGLAIEKYMSETVKKTVKKSKPYFDSLKVKSNDEQISEGGKMIASKQFSQLGKSVLFWKGYWISSAPALGKIYYIDSDTLEVVHTLDGPRKQPGKFYSRFGAAMQVVTVMGTEYLVVSSPGQSQLDLFDYDAEYRGTLVWPDAIIEYGATGIKLVGESLLADWTGLFVGAPYADVDESQTGAIYKISYEQLAEVVLLNETQYVQNEPIPGPSKFARFGMKLATSNQFVLVGAPGTSKVFGYDPWTVRLKLTLDGPEHSGFGGYLLEQSPQGYIAIGAPLHDHDGAQSGSVFVYKNTVRHAFSGGSSFAYFGQSGAISGSTLYIGSSHADNERGAIWKLDLSRSELSKFTSGCLPASGGFASEIALNNTHILAGVPYYDQLGGLALYNITV